MTQQDRLSTLGLLWAAWEQQGRALAAEQWQQPTRLGDWTVRMLYAHAAGWTFGFTRWGCCRSEDELFPVPR